MKRIEIHRLHISFNRFHMQMRCTSTADALKHVPDFLWSILSLESKETHKITESCQNIISDYENTRIRSLWGPLWGPLCMHLGVPRGPLLVCKNPARPASPPNQTCFDAHAMGAHGPLGPMAHIVPIYSFSCMCYIFRICCTCVCRFVMYLYMFVCTYFIFHIYIYTYIYI